MIVTVSVLAAAEATGAFRVAPTPVIAVVLSVIIANFFLIENFTKVHPPCVLLPSGSNGYICSIRIFRTVVLPPPYFVCAFIKADMEYARTDIPLLVSCMVAPPF